MLFLPRVYFSFTSAFLSILPISFILFPWSYSIGWEGGERNKYVWIIYTAIYTAGQFTA